MNDDYLWDRRGAPDPEVARLEKLLEGYRYRRPRPAWLAEPRRVRWQWLAAAAAVVLLIGAGLWLATFRSPASPWQVARVEGAAQVGEAQAAAGMNLPPSEWLVTDDTARAHLESPIGAIEVEPNTRLRLLRGGKAEHRMEMPRGTIHAFIWAPPRQFYVETPSAVAIDLGCAYTLHVDDSGAGLVRVLTGWVAFERNGRESFIPAGALCATRPGIGPGTPYLEDASEVFRAALQRLDFEQLGPAERAATLRVALKEARAPAAFSLWHLLKRAGPEERPLIYDRLAALAPPPAGVTREGVLAADAPMLDRWWDSLGHGQAEWFRLYKGNGPSPGR